MTRFLRLARLFLAVAGGLEARPPEKQLTIVELQPYRQSSSMAIRSRGGREGSANLVNLNPAINGWYLLKLVWNDTRAEAAYHLENPAPLTRKVLLDEKYSSGLIVVEGASRYSCDLFGANGLDQAKASPLPFYPLCEGRLYLRNSATGHRTSLEAATEFVRGRVWGGERIIALGHVLMGDAHWETGKMETQASASAKTGPQARDFPLPAVLDSKYDGQSLSSSNLGIELGGAGKSGMTPGAWYRTSGNPGIYVSILRPNLIDPAILGSYKTIVSSLDSIEAAALSYLVAFDLDQFEVGYALGTEHPSVVWSNHLLPQMRDPALPGPEGIGTIRPLVSTGLINPQDVRKTVATFTAGFKRAHGAFKLGDLALQNHGSHYGFIENGVVFSKLQPGLSTIFVLDDGSVEMKTWTEADNKLLARIKHARQNGVPLIDFDAASESPVPGRLVGSWGMGNWSGSEDSKLRTMRSGAAMQTSHGKHFLIYAVFSSATPSAMARIFQAYQCDYAMLLDMNALEHTYLALYRRSGSQLFVDHLVKGMAVLDGAASGQVVPRFLGYPDNRDFFYLMRKGGNP